MEELKPTEIKALWNHFDRNKDGLITRDELAEMLKANIKKQLSLDLPLPPAMLDEAFNLMDVNHGGSIDYEEFKENINKYWAIK